MDKILENTPNKYFEPDNDNMDGVSEIKLFVNLQNLKTFNKDKTLLKNIVDEHVKVTDQSSVLSLKAYYKPLKLSSAFSTRVPKPTLQRTGVVYRFDCTVDGCQASYIGHTTCTLERRCKQHRYSPSNIFKHYDIDHEQPVPNHNEFALNFSIIHSYLDVDKIKIAESIAIKQHRPYINVKFDEMSSFINLYR